MHLGTRRASILPIEQGPVSGDTCGTAARTHKGEGLGGRLRCVFGGASVGVLPSSVCVGRAELGPVEMPFDAQGGWHELHSALLYCLGVPSVDGAPEAEDAFGHHDLLFVSEENVQVGGMEVVGDLPRCQPKVAVLGWFQEALDQGTSRCGNHVLCNLLEEL